MTRVRQAILRMFRTAVFRYTLLAATFGLFFPVMSTYLQLHLSALPLTLAAAVKLQASQPLLRLIDTYPLFLGLLASLAGGRQDQLSRLKVGLEGKVAEQTAALRLKTVELEQEVAQRREADSELIQAYKELDQILNTSANGIRVIDRDFNVIKANKAFIEMVGIGREEIVGKKCHSFFQGPHCHSPDCTLTQILKGHSFLEEVLPRKCGAQKTIVTHMAASPLVNREGNIIGVVEDIRDITDHIEDQEALAESEERYRRLFEQSGDAIFIHDLEGRMLDVNESACQMLDCPREELLSRSMRSLHHGDEQATVCDLLESMKTAGKVHLESRFLKPDGTAIDVEIAARLIDREKGLVQQNVRDTTERKQAVAALRKALEELEEANSLKSRFLFNVSHEIRTPLNGIIGFAEAITASFSLEDIHHRARTILQESESLLSLVNELLDLGKIEAGHLELACRPIDLTGLLEDVIADAAPQAEAKGLQYHLSIQEETPRFIVADPVRVRQVLTNLLSNAIKFTAEGSVSLTLEPVQVQASQAIIHFSMTDTGVGIPKEKQDMVFRSFAQGDVSTTRRYGGIGLGTSIVLQLVSLMGGQVGLQSEPGKGSTFWFNLPVKIAEPSEVSEEVEKHRTQGNSEVQDQGAPHTILIVDDHVTNQEIMKLHLEDKGYRVEIAANGEEAVTACSQRDFDLILMDLQMPVMDGLEATRQIRSLKIKAPILALTASAEAGTKESCEKSGMNDIIEKPVRKSSLLTVIGHWLSSRDHDLHSEACPGLAQEKREAAMAVESAPLDYELAVQEFGGNKDLVETVAAQFITKAEKQLQLLREAIDRQDAEAVRLEAHSIKGAAATLTAMALSAAAAQLEAKAKSGTVADSEVLWAEVHKEYERLAQFFHPDQR